MRKDIDARNHHAAFEITMREHEDPEATIYKSVGIMSYFLKMLQWGHPSACGVARRNEELPLERGVAAGMQGCRQNAGLPEARGVARRCIGPQPARKVAVCAQTAV